MYKRERNLNKERRKGHALTHLLLCRHYRFSLRDGCLTLVELINLGIGEVLEVLLPECVGKILDVLVDLTAVALELSLNEDVTLLREVNGITGCEDVDCTNLTLADCLVMLLEHEVLEVIEEIRLPGLISENPVEELAVTESVTWEGEGASLLNPCTLGLAEVAPNAEDITICSILTEVIIPEGYDRLNVLHVDDDL